MRRAAIILATMAALSGVAEAAATAAISGAAASRGSRSSSSDLLRSGKTCTFIGVDQKDGEHLYKCVDIKEPAPKRPKPVMRCGVV